MSVDFDSYRQTGLKELRSFSDELVLALRYPFERISRVALTLGVGVVTFYFLILFAQPQGLMTVLRNPEFITLTWLEQMFMINFTTIYHESVLIVAINGIYAILTGVAITNMIAQLRMMQVGSVANVGGILPGLFAAGCASCGPGLYAIFGITGAMSVLPFQQSLLRFGGIALFLVFLGLSGDPRSCSID